MLHKKYLSLIFVFLFFSTLFPKIENIISGKRVFSSNKIKKNRKKRILILMSKGGAGHVSASNAIKSYLKSDFNVKIVNFFEDIIPEFDLFHKVSTGKFNGEDVYNWCLRHRFTNILHCLARLGSWSIRFKESMIEDLTFNYINSIKPDLIISVMPLINNAVLNVAKKLKLSFLIVTNDLDTTAYVNSIQNPKYKKFYYTFPFNDSEMKKKIKQANISKNQIKFTGFPLRPEFFENKNKQKIQKDFSVPKNKKTVMLLMGGAGSYANYSFIKTISKSKIPIHLIVCLGKNEKLRKSIEKIKLPDHITMTPVGFTKRISDLMAISDVIITKPGPGSICEAIASNLPIIVDQTGKTLWWEVMNIDFVKKNKLGEVVTSFRQTNQKLEKFLKDHDYITKLKERMQRFHNQSLFEKNIKKLVREILNK